MLNTISYIWQLPQHLLGLLLLLYYKGEERHNLYGVKFYYCRGFSGGISLGEYIILGSMWEKDIRHEWGHCIQSKYLGPLYLIVIGLPSLLHAGFCNCINHSYYDFYTEKWADKLGGVKR